MYKIILVDDEKMIRNGIRNMVPWKQIGINRVFTAASATEALPIIEKEKPEIMLTDICMTNIDGLTLIDRVNSTNPNTKIMVLTGYDNFEYAQRCCKMGVQDFILKPVDEAYLIEAIKKQVSTLEENKDALRNQRIFSRIQGISEQIKIEGTMRDIIHGRAEVGDLSQFFEEYHYRENQAMQVAILVYTPNDDTKWNGYDDLLTITIKNMCIERFDYMKQGITFQDDDGRILVAIFGSNNFDEIIERVEHIKNLVEEELEIRLKIVLGSFVKGFGQMSLSYADGLNLLHNSHDIYKDIIQPHRSEQRLIEFNGIFQDLKKAMNKNIGHPDEVVKAYMAFDEATKTYSLSNSLVRRYCFDMASSLYLNYLDETDKTLDNRLTSLLNLLLNSSSEDARKITKNFVIQLTSQDYNDIHDLVSAAKRYINDNLSENLSVSSIAERLYITPNYFSKLFKKEIGRGCNDYIVYKRIDKAKSLLATTNIKTGEIANMVGYSDINYFSLSFKKNTGMSPTKYRKHYRKSVLIGKA